MLPPGLSLQRFVTCIVKQLDGAEVTARGSEVESGATPATTGVKRR